MSAIVKTADDFDREYLAVHVRKEDLFWSTYMGTNPEPKAFEEAEASFKGYISDPARIDEVNASIAALASKAAGPEVEEERKNLEGWRRLFMAHSTPTGDPKRLEEELIGLEARMQQERAALKLEYKDRAGETYYGSTNVLATNLVTSPDETVRKSSHDSLLELERWVLEHGLLDQIKARNALARSMGFPDYFAYKVRKNEAMSVEDLSRILDEFEVMTRDRCFSELDRLAREKGPESILGHNLRYSIRGDAERAMDPYMPFEKALEIWARSFRKLGIRYRGATLTLDLLERSGKFENGFMHGPMPTVLRHGAFTPARINFTSNATPNQVGSGQTGLTTLFHEGGHAAHFSNVVEGSPCFSQEYAPTSMALAEMQSMFCDSLLEDADWLAMYAKDRQGNAAPKEIIRALIVAKHPFMAFAERSILVVSVFERALYGLSDEELTPTRVLELARDCEKRILGVSPAPRPLLAIPHLIASESACSYHGYLLAHMAVHQARGFFLRRDGFVADNPRVGPELADRCWSPGNAVSFSEAVARLVGEGLSGRDLAAICNRPTDEYWADHVKRMEAAVAREKTQDNAPFELDALIRIVHGDRTVATNERGMASMFQDFEAFVKTNWPREQASA